MTRVADQTRRSDILNGVKPLVIEEPRERSLGDWMRCLWNGDRKTLEARYRSKAALAESSGVTGGYTVPTAFVKDVFTVAAEESLFLRYAQQVPLTTHETIVPHVAVNAGAAGTSPFFGGMVFTWTPENASQAETEPTFQATTLRANTLAGYALVSNQMMADASDGELTKYLTDLMGRAAGWQLDYGCFNGDGAGKPLGVVNAPGSISVTRAGGNDVSAVDLAKMAAKLIPCGWGPPEIAFWGVHPSALEKILALSTWQISQTPGPAGQLYIHGMPAFVTEKLPGLGTKGDVVLVIPRLYLVGTRAEVEVSVSRSEPTAYLKNQSVVRVVLRADGCPRLNTSVTLADGTKTAAACVVLN